jgi:hypothetical protein
MRCSIRSWKPLHRSKLEGISTTRESSWKRRHLEDSLHDVRVVLALPEKYRKRLHTMNMLERLI